MNNPRQSGSEHEFPDADQCSETSSPPRLSSDPQSSDRTEPRPPGQLRRMILTGIALVLVVALAVGASGYIYGTLSDSDTLAPAAPQPSDPSHQSVIPAGQRVDSPYFTATTMAGNDFQITDTIGSPTLIVFWSHW